MLAFLLIDSVNYLEKLVLIVLCLSTNSLVGHTIGSLNSTDASLAFLVLQLLSHPMCKYYRKEIYVDSRLFCYNRKLNVDLSTCMMLCCYIPAVNSGITVWFQHDPVWIVNT